MLAFHRRLMRSLREDRVLGTLRRASYHAYERFREWSLGIRTSERVKPYECAADEERRPYEPLCFACIDRAMSHLVPSPADVLIDYGCGRGRVLAVAATYRIRKVIGIELCPELCDSACDNLRRVRGRRCPEWEVIEEDAAVFVVPSEVTIAFLFNPFLEQILMRVIERLEESVRSHPRKLSVIYMNPESDRDLFAECSWLSLQAELPVGLWQGMRFRHYQSVIPAPQ